MNAFRHRPIGLLATLLLAAGLFGACTLGSEEVLDPNTLSTPTQEVQGEDLFTRCNIWYEKPRIPSINYKRGGMIPAGTRVTNVRTVRLSRARAVYGIQFTLPDGATLILDHEPRYWPGLTIDDVKERFFTPQPLADLTRGMNELELEGIKKGVLTDGMSKDAVLIAWGYPPAHRTPSLSSNRWTYWKARFGEKLLFFNESGRTVNVNVGPPNQL
jgi:hypothetical protein